MQSTSPPTTLHMVQTLVTSAPKLSVNSHLVPTIWGFLGSFVFCALFVKKKTKMTIKCICAVLISKGEKVLHAATVILGLNLGLYLKLNQDLIIMLEIKLLPTPWDFFWFQANAKPNSAKRHLNRTRNSNSRSESVSCIHTH